MSKEQKETVEEVKTTQATEQAKETPAEKKARVTKERAEAKEAKEQAKAEAKAEKAKEREKAKEAKAEAKAKAKANKPPGVIASILDAVKEAKSPITQEEVLGFLQKRFPDRDTTSMLKTVRAQLGGKAQPTRMEKEKSVEFEITFVTKEVEDKEGNVTTENTKIKKYLYVGEVAKETKA